MGRPKGRQNSRLCCECGRCLTYKKRDRDRRIASGERVPRPSTRRETPFPVPDGAPAPHPHGGWGSMEACLKGGIMSEIVRNQAAFFARSNERFAARIAEVISG